MMNEIVQYMYEQEQSRSRHRENSPKYIEVEVLSDVSS